MKCEITYLRTDEEKVVAVLYFERNRDDAPEVWDVISRQPKGCCGGDVCPLTAESGSLESEPLETIEDARDWAEKQFKKAKGKIEAYRMSQRLD